MAIRERTLCQNLIYFKQKEEREVSFPHKSYETALYCGETECSARN